MDMNKHIWEGWTVGDFIENIEFLIDYHKDRLKTKEDVKKFCIDNQPYYKKNIPEVTKYFCNKLGIK